MGYTGTRPRTSDRVYIYICHFCRKPTFFDHEGTQTPGVSFGSEVKDIPDKTVEALYNESRRTMSTGSFTAAVLCCRKLLMHIAVSKGAEPGDQFINYVQFLSDQHYVPVDAKEWVDHIREKGNEANHEIVIMDKGTAENLITFSEMLLKQIYEFPAAAKRGKKKPQVA
jgi:hypothetical protein